MPKVIIWKWLGLSGLLSGYISLIYMFTIITLNGGCASFCNNRYGEQMIEIITLIVFFPFVLIFTWKALEKDD